MHVRTQYVRTYVSYHIISMSVYVEQPRYNYFDSPGSIFVPECDRVLATDTLSAHICRYISPLPPTLNPYSLSYSAQSPTGTSALDLPRGNYCCYMVVTLHCHLLYYNTAATTTTTLNKSSVLPHRFWQAFSAPLAVCGLFFSYVQLSPSAPARLRGYGRDSLLSHST